MPCAALTGFVVFLCSPKCHPLMWLLSLHHHRDAAATALRSFGDWYRTISRPASRSGLNFFMSIVSTSVFTVGFSGGGRYERCCVSGKVGRFNTSWQGDGKRMPRKFPIDTAGFSFSASIFCSKNPQFDASVPQGFLKSDFLGQMATNYSELLPLGGNCTKILVWHTQNANPCRGFKPALYDELQA
jgi:Glycosyltransferase family 43